jgi:hypothetical protein
VLELREAVAVGEVEQKKADQAGCASLSPLPPSVFLFSTTADRLDRSTLTVALEEKYRKAWRKFVMLEQKLYSSLLATADVFCATALGSGTSKVLGVSLPFLLLIVEQN